MGIFKDLNNAKKAAKDLAKNTPRMPMAGAADQMRQANSMLADMAAQAAATTAAITNGVDATATITSATQTGAVVNFNPVVALDLLVMMPNGIPTPVQRQETVMQIHLARCQPGGQLKVKVDPANSSSLWIDWNSPA